MDRLEKSKTLRNREIQRILNCLNASSLLSSSIILIIFIFVHQIHSFNLDTKIPVYKFGPKDSYFGYSVAEHIIKRSSQLIPVILVGAPRTKTDRIRTGALFKCDLSTRTRDCSNLYVDLDNSTFLDNVDKEDQWLGVTVKSQGIGGYVMVCAHRYVHKGKDFRWGNGICYSLTQYLDYSRTYEPCRGRLVNLAHEEFGFCQAGTSGEISKDHEILIGSPGPYTWRGTVFSNSIRYSIKDDKTWYMGPVIEGKSPVSKYSYLGMSVASGDFFGDKLMIASGAPRSNGTGEVIFYSKDSGKIEFDLRGILHGQQFASSFGYSLASLDCDGDKHSDLAVGAPFYYNDKEGGSVYVFLQKDLRSGTFDKFTRLSGKLESRFGFSLANAGDLNKDHFDDLAIGAPYEKNGVVYIYSGSASGIKTQPSQVIDAMEFPSPLNYEIKTFGYSLSGGLDMDSNSYPDLLIGAYESDAVVLLRSRPIIKIKTSVKGNMTQIDPKHNGCPDDPSSKKPCFSVQPCFQFLGASNSMQVNSFSKFELKYRIEAETFEKKYYRVIFKDASINQTPNIVEKTILFDYGYNREYCLREVIYLKENFSDIQNPIPFKLTYSLKQTQPQLPREGDSLPDINEYPILDQEEAQRIFYAKFNKECGSDDICDSNLLLKAKLLKAVKKEDNNYKLTLDDEIILMNISLVNRAEPAYDAYIIIEHTPNLHYVGRKSGEVDCTTISKIEVKCDMGNPFKRGRIDFQIRFSTNNIGDDEREFNIKVKVETTSNDVSQLDNVVEFNTEVLRKAELQLKGVSIEPQVFFGGEVKGEVAMKFEDEIGPKVIHRYIVINNGPLRAKDVFVLIDWPYQLESKREFGKWLLYIVAMPSVTGSGTEQGYCELDANAVNPEHFQSVYDEPIRRKRSNQLEQAQKLKKNKEQEKQYRLACGNGARCVKIKCWIPLLEANKTSNIFIRSRLWNATFVEDFSHYNRIIIESTGKIRLHPLYNIIQNEQDDTFTIETQAIPDKIFKPPKASWLYYIIGAFLGLFILFIIVYVCYKIGFFKRNKEYHQVNNTDYVENYN